MDKKCILLQLYIGYINLLIGESDVSLRQSLTGCSRLVKDLENAVAKKNRTPCVCEGRCYGIENARTPSSPSIMKGQPITLNCTFDLEDDTLYSIKWYKNNVEFFTGKEANRFVVENSFCLHVTGLFGDCLSALLRYPKLKTLDGQKDLSVGTYIKLISHIECVPKGYQTINLEALLQRFLAFDFCVPYGC
ncbi:hypothetical protein CEXT_691241 [Caerostris extrusa]|uniref:Ig-like domain-containing protein n=1 Tax=Caerostris extrusa TaxID=172846 RepID=A0AAV4WX86_CAEEX|nr:hypothetical protein CEXT_691241 [Caerostris extrusa]